MLWPGFNQFLCVPEPSEVEVEPSPNVSESVLDLLNEFLFDIIVFLLDVSLPVVPEDMQFLGTGTGSARIGCMYKLRYEFLPNLNEFLLDLNQWCLLFEASDLNSTIIYGLDGGVGLDMR